MPAPCPRMGYAKLKGSNFLFSSASPKWACCLTSSSPLFSGGSGSRGQRGRGASELEKASGFETSLHEGVETRFRPRCCLRVIFFLLFTSLVLRAAVYAGTREPGLMQACTAVHACADTRMPAWTTQRSGGMQRREMGRPGGSLGLRLSHYSLSIRRCSAALSGNTAREAAFSFPSQTKSRKGRGKTNCVKAQAAAEPLHPR